MNWYAVLTWQTGYPQPEDNYQWLIETYDKDNFCPTCTIGKVQRNPFIFKSEPKSKHSHFIGLNWVFDEIFIRDEVKNIFENKGITGVEYLRPVILRGKVESKTIWQMKVINKLTTHVNSSNLTVEHCEMPKDANLVKFLKANGSRLVEGPFCGNIKYNIPKDKLIYNKNAFDYSTDITKTLDWFGSGGNSIQLIIISERVKSIIDEYNWRGLFYIPIQIIESCT